MTKFFCALFILFSFHLFSQDLAWAKEIRSSPTVYGNLRDCVTAADDGLIICAATDSITDIDPGPSEFLIVPDNGITSYLQKLSADGSFDWGLQIPATYSVIDIDTSGNLLLAGSFTGSRDFNSGPEEFILTANATGSQFILKLDPTGQFLWAKKWDIGVTSPKTCIKASANGKIAVSGNYSGFIDADPGTGFFSIGAAGQTRKYILQLDTDGNFEWANQISSSQFWEGDSKNGHLACDAFGNVFYGAAFYQNINFTPNIPANQISANQNSYDNFVVKYGNSGNIEWTRIFGSNNDYDYLRSIDVDSAGNVYCAGKFNYYIDFDGGSFGDADLEAFSISSPTTGYVVRYNSNGDYSWSNAISGQFSADTYTIKINSLNQVLCMGVFGGQIDANSNSGTNWNASSDAYDTFFFRFESDSTQIDYKLYGGVAGMVGGAPVHLISPMNNGEGYYAAFEFYGPLAQYDGITAITAIDNQEEMQKIAILNYGSCAAFGCTDSEACNFNPEANCDNGSCVFSYLADLDDDCEVGISDLAIMLENFGCISDCPEADLNGDGMVTVDDIIIWIGE